MARFAAIAFVLGASFSVGAMANPPPAKPSQQPLIDGLHALGASLTTQSQGQGASPQSQAGQHSQGADHASDVAIMHVCSHDNPSAQRAAICGRPNSPP